MKKKVISANPKPTGFGKVAWEAINASGASQDSLKSQTPKGWISPSTPGDDEVYPGQMKDTVDVYENEYNVQPESTPKPEPRKVIVGISESGVGGIVSSSTKAKDKIGQLKISGQLKLAANETTELTAKHDESDESKVSYSWSADNSRVKLTDTTNKKVTVVGRKPGICTVKCIVKHKNGTRKSAKVTLTLTSLSSENNCYPDNDPSSERMPLIKVFHTQNVTNDDVDQFKVTIVGGDDIKVYPIGYDSPLPTQGDPDSYWENLEAGRYYMVQCRRAYDFDRMKANIEDSDVSSGGQGGSQENIELGAVEKISDTKFKFSFRKTKKNNGVDIPGPDQPKTFCKEWYLGDKSIDFDSCAIEAEQGSEQNPKPEEEVVIPDGPTGPLNRLMDTEQLMSRVRYEDAQIFKEACDKWNAIMRYEEGLFSNEMMNYDAQFKGIRLADFTGSHEGKSFKDGVAYYSSSTNVVASVYQSDHIAGGNLYLGATFALAINSTTWNKFDYKGKVSVIEHELAHAIGFPNAWRWDNAPVGRKPTADALLPLAEYPALAETYRKHTGNNTYQYIPLEECGGAGTSSAHWDKKDRTVAGTRYRGLQDELLIGTTDGTTLSAITGKFLEDIGYEQFGPYERMPRLGDLSNDPDVSTNCNTRVLPYHEGHHEDDTAEFFKNTITPTQQNIDDWEARRGYS